MLAPESCLDVEYMVKIRLFMIGKVAVAFPDAEGFWIPFRGHDLLKYCLSYCDAFFSVQRSLIFQDPDTLAPAKSGALS